MAPCIETTSPTSTIIKMSNSEEAQDGNEDSIKAAVREATRKTQERLAAYQKKQAANKAAQAEEERNKQPSKDAQQAESTVAKLQALVGESRRLTAKSREMNQAANVTKETTTTTTPSALEPTTPKTPGLARSMSSDPNMASKSVGTAPKGRKLSEIFQNLGGSSSNLSIATPTTPAALPGLRRSATIDASSIGSSRIATSSATPTHTPGGSLAKGKKLGALFQSLNGSERSLSSSITKLAAGSEETKQKVLPMLQSSLSSASLNIALSPKNTTTKAVKGKEAVKGKKRVSKPQALEEPGDDDDLIDDIDIDEEDYEDDEEEDEAKTKKSGKKKATKPKEEEDDDSSGEYSIFSLVDDGIKKTAAVAGVEGLRNDEIQDLMEDYYNDPQPVPAATKQALDSSLPLLEAILETPKPDKPKAKVGGLKKSGGKVQGKSMSAIPNGKKKQEEEEDLDSSMPMLAPFETPKVEKPKLMHATAKSVLMNGDTKKDNIPAPVMAMQEESLNLSQIMKQSDMLVPDHANSRAKNDDENNNTSQGSGSHKGGLRRPSMEHGNEEEDNNTRSSSRMNRSGRRRSNEREDDEANRRRSKSKSGRKRSGRRSSIGKNSDHKRNEELASRAINKYHRTGGQGSSTMEGLEVCEKTGEVRPEMDISAISENSAENDKSLQDGSDLGGSSHSSHSQRSMSRSSRRGRTSAAEPGSRSRGVSRSRSRRSVARSVSRSASVRRSKRRGMDDSKSVNRQSSRRNSIAGTTPDDDKNNSSLRADRSMRDVSSRRSRLQASARDNSLRDSSMKDGRRRRSVSTRRQQARRNTRRGDDDEASTAEDILGSLDVSDIHIVGDEEEKKSKMDASESGRTSIYKKERRNSLAGLSKLESTEEAKPEGDDESVTGSVQSSTTKKSKMGKFARKVGRRLTMKKKKKKGATGEEDESEDGEEEEEDADLEQLAAEFDEEEKEIFEKSGSLHESFSKGDFSQVQALDEGDQGDTPKSKKKHRPSMFGKIKKIGKIGKKSKKKDKKGKGSEILESDSESSEDELLGSEYSGGTPERSQSESQDEDELGASDDFVQLQIDGSVVHGSDRTEDPATITPKGRPRRVSTIANRRRGANQQRMSLQAALEATPRRNSLRGEESSVQGSIATTNTNMRNRRARSLRGKIQRKGEMDGSINRTKSLKGRVEGEAGAKFEKGVKKIRRTRSVEMMNSTGEEGDAPAFDWSTYSAQKETAPPSRDSSAGRRGKGKRRSQADKRMSGGLSKVIYAGQGVAS